ncbi:hypothetical protein [Microvirga sp. 17 mud 1-3]|uniref:hypothetical protein n=1 Tax=Microvirga sp. 17 mud 1-3 TaxID=2082949 RepID=UPI0013A53F18|nr:hypothetical protein [Microvirga sp. 17 mud 1-3]
MRDSSQILEGGSGRSAYPLALCLSMLAILIGSSAVFGFILAKSNYGIDLTDESYYVLWMARPWDYTESATQFGFIYHILYVLLSGDVVYVRRANLFITFGLAFIFGVFLFRRLLGECRPLLSIRSAVYNFVVVGLAASLAATSLAIFAPWLPTPNYNSLGLQGLLLAGIGVILAEGQLSLQSKIGWITIGAAGWLVLMAKPPSAVALAIVVVAYLAISRKLNIRLFLLSVTTAAVLLLGSAWLIDGSPRGFGERLIRAANLYGTLEAGHTVGSMFRVGTFIVTDTIAYVMEVVAVVVLVLILVAVFVSRKVGIIVCAFGAMVTVGFLVGAVSVDYPYTTFQSTLLLSAPIGGMLAAVIIGRSRFVASENRSLIALFGCLIFFPYIYAFGTSNNYWMTGPMAAIFWVAASLVLLRIASPSPEVWALFLPVLVASQLVVIGLLSISMNYPYRQTQALRQNNELVYFGEGGTRMRVSRDFAAYFAALRQVGQAENFRPRTPLINLSGHYPGIAVVLSAKAIGQPWLPGGYAGSQAFAGSALDGVSCDEIARAWVFVEPGGPLKISDDVLQRYGISLDQDYVRVGKFSSPKGAFPTSYEQYLLKPNRTPEEARLGCEQKRRSVAQ